MVRPLPDGGRGHPDRGDAGRHRVELGDLPRVPRQCRTPAEGAQLRHVYRPFGAAHVRDGQARPRREGDRGRSARHGARRRRGDPGRRARLLDLARDDAHPPGRRSRSPAASPTGRRSTVLVGAMAELNSGIFQIGPDISGGEAQRVFLERLRKVALDSGRPIMFGTLATKQGNDPNPWDYQMRWIDETVAQGGRIWGQATTRSINAIFSLKSYLPFDYLPEWQRDPRAAARRAEGAAARSRGARPPRRRGSPDEAERRRRCRAAAPRRPTRASPITPICSRCSTSIGTTRASPSWRAGATSTRSKSSSICAWRTTTACSCSRWSTNRRTTCSAC